MSDRDEVRLEPLEHALLATQHWASDGVHAIIVECTQCPGRTFVGYGADEVDAEAVARRHHDEWVRAGAPPAEPQGVELLYQRYGFSAGGSRPGDAAS